MTTPRRQLARSGFTLIELLIVVTILIMVTVAAIPLLGPSTRGRQVREAARELSAYIAGARAKALEIGRPAGIWLERFPRPPANASQADLQALSETGGLHFCVNVYTAITPPPYSGDTLDSRVVVQNGRVTKFVPATGWMGLVRPGDLMKLNFQGRLYQIQVTDPSVVDERGYLKPNSLQAGWLLSPVDFNSDPVVPNTPLTGVPYQIFRQPVRSNDAPLQLPGTAVIDLDLSGLDSRPAGQIGPTKFSGGTFAAVPTPGSGTPTIDTNPVIIMFGPGGALDRIYYRGGQFIIPTEPVFLLVGRREKVYPGEPQESSEEQGVQFNYQDTGHWCLSLGHQTGRITVTELAVFDDPSPLTGSNPLAKARHFARLAQSTGGR